MMSGLQYPWLSTFWCGVRCLIFHLRPYKQARPSRCGCNYQWWKLLNITYFVCAKLSGEIWPGEPRDPAGYLSRGLIFSGRGPAHTAQIRQEVNTFCWHTLHQPDYLCCTTTPDRSTGWPPTLLQSCQKPVHPPPADSSCSIGSSIWG